MWGRGREKGRRKREKGRRKRGEGRGKREEVRGYISLLDKGQIVV